MKPQNSNPILYGQSPLWAERRIPRGAVLSDMPSLLLLKVPDEETWIVASPTASNAIANPHSPLGGLLRSYCGLLSLRYLSNN